MRGFSGGNLERPQFKKMMKDSQKIAFAAIVVYRLDRISRNIGDFANKPIEDLGDRHIDFISIREQFDTSSPMGRAMMYIASVFSQLERGDHRRAHPGQHARAVQDRTLAGRHNAHGLRLRKPVQRDGGRQGKKACKLKPIPEEIQLVKTIFSVFMETGSLSKTDQYLLEHRCVTKRGKQFTRFAIRGILTNPVYMIADETAYQYLKENNVDLFAERAAANVALLSGLLRCGECGDYMRPKLTNRKNADDELIYTYMCSTKERSHGTVCSMKNCNGNTLDAKIIEEIRKLSADKETLTGCWRRPRRLSAAARRATMQSLRCSGRNTPRRKNASNGWWSPCPLPATPQQSMSWSRSTSCTGRASRSKHGFPSWKPSPNRAGCCIRSSPSIRK